MLVFVPLNSVWLMLNACAQGWAPIRRGNNWSVVWGEKEYPSIPVVEPGGSIKSGYVRQLIATLGIDPDCAKKHFPNLYG